MYDEVILLCLDLEEIDAAIAVVAEMETNGIKVLDETLDRVLAAKQSGNGKIGRASCRERVYVLV